MKHQTSRAPPVHPSHVGWGKRVQGQADSLRGVERRDHGGLDLNLDSGAGLDAAEQVTEEHGMLDPGHTTL